MREAVEAGPPKLWLHPHASTWVPASVLSLTAQRKAKLLSCLVHIGQGEVCAYVIALSQDERTTFL